MNIRQANKIQKQVSPSEINNKSRAYWDRYNRSWLYSQRLYRRLIRKKRKEGKFLWSDTELNKLIDEILNEIS
ncbi:hypothetical protein [Bacteroides fragilis]|uniref:hypothetical protein n=1 Tax=Bacteroides fragilis TaxID=817 RepID=UPI00202E0509|nr:hypothetical protein [Bacteroides fragilis]MCM0314284.1 hypothetical protein [Bacteroides fragilis]